MNKINKEKKKKETKKEKKHTFLSDVKSEMKKVVFPSAKDVFKYTIATIIFCFLLVGFFMILSLLLSVIKGMF